MPLPPTLVILLSILKHFDLADKKCRIFYKIYILLTCLNEIAGKGGETIKSLQVCLPGLV